MTEKPPQTAAIDAATAPKRAKPSVYPEPFASRMSGRTKRPLGDLFGLANFGVNLTELAPGGESALMHRHKTQDEFVYVVSGHPTLVTEDGTEKLAPGMCAGFPAGGAAHQLRNDTDEPALYLEIGDRSPGDAATYPNDDLRADLNDEGRWVFSRKDGTPY